MDGKNIAFIIEYKGSGDCPSVIRAEVDYSKLTQQTIDSIESHQTSYTGIECFYTSDWNIESDLRNLTQLPKGSVIDEFMLVTLDG